MSAAGEAQQNNALRGVSGTGLIGLYGQPFVSLDALLDLDALDAVHEEVCIALAQLPVDYTGGSHRSMQIMPEGLEHEALVDYGEVLPTLDDAQWATFCSLADDPEAYAKADRSQDLFGEERALPLSRRQMLWLKYRHRVYWPWKVYVELMPNRFWKDKSSAEGKRFTRNAQTFFPRTLAFVRSLPFVHIGRCNIMGLEAHDHGTVHRDGAPHEQQSPDPFITFCPAAGKRLYLWDPTRREKVAVTGRAYWFNDHDYHGVESDPYFRYSIRVDGVFEPSFLARIEQQMEARA